MIEGAIGQPWRFSSFWPERSTPQSPQRWGLGNLARLRAEEKFVKSDCRVAAVFTGARRNGRGGAEDQVHAPGARYSSQLMHDKRTMFGRLQRACGRS